MNPPSACSRRDFLARAAALPAASTLVWRSLAAEPAPMPFAPPIVLFTKVCAQAGLNLDQTADLIAAAGLDGVDCPVRPKDEILPERVKEDLPRYAELLQKRGRKLSLLTTAILSPASPHTQDILRTARQLGVRDYRLGFLRVPKGAYVPKLVEQTRANLKALAALNQELGLCAMIQNHSPSGSEGYLGGDLAVMEQLVRGFNPAQIGVAFDLGHALLVHGDDWPKYFTALQPHLRVAYVKDTHRQRRFVPFGEGEFARTDYFKRLKAMKYTAPLSLHIEYDWDQAGKARTAPALQQAAKTSTETLRRWLAAA
jgi:sugar phosphate isomerase/epimerase